jgi:flagellar basal-body rod modification protein FlgD
MPVDAIGNILNPVDPSVTQNNTIDQQDFIKLFLSQLQFQDPLEPVDNREFLAQLAQFSNLEQTRQTSQNTESLLVMQSSSAALTLLGKTVEVQLLGSDTPATGDVVAVNFTQQGPLLSVQPAGGAALTDIRLAQVTLVTP